MGHWFRQALCLCVFLLPWAAYGRVEGETSTAVDIDRQYAVINTVPKADRAARKLIAELRSANLDVSQAIIEIGRVGVEDSALAAFINTLRAEGVNPKNIRYKRISRDKFNAVLEQRERLFEQEVAAKVESVALDQGMIRLMKVLQAQDDPGAPQIHWNRSNFITRIRNALSDMRIRWRHAIGAPNGIVLFEYYMKDKREVKEKVHDGLWALLSVALSTLALFESLASDQEKSAQLRHIESAAAWSAACAMLTGYPALGHMNRRKQGKYFDFERGRFVMSRKGSFFHNFLDTFFIRQIMMLLAFGGNWNLDVASSTLGNNMRNVLLRTPIEMVALKLYELGLISEAAQKVSIQVMGITLTCLNLLDLTYWSPNLRIGLVALASVGLLGELFWRDRQMMANQAERVWNSKLFRRIRREVLHESVPEPPANCGETLLVIRAPRVIEQGD